MSAAGTPSTDPWVIVARERARYEEQFKSLKPINGVVTGDQAKGFLLQSSLPPLVLGQIWALADTDADGKMDINEFSIACKLINLKLRGFEIPKGLPPSLLASLKVNTPPAIPPLPNPALVNAPPRPEPPKVAPMMAVQPPPSLIQAPPSTTQPLVPNLTTASSGLIGINTMIPTGIVPPMQSNGFGSTVVVPPLIPAVPPSTAPIQHISPVGVVAPLSSVVPSATGPGATSTPRASITSLDRTTSIESLQSDWSVPHQTKLKYTQIFNTTDRTRTGFLSGAQARNVMVQTKLPQHLLAQIWSLSDMDSDGRLGCEEFVLAMHLCEQAAQGVPPPTKLPLDLIPPSFRRSTRTASISSQGSAPLDQDPASTLLQTSFEDKRKENFEKGQAELERRRKALLDQQRKEAEERERKEREEQERKEKARQEAERKRLEELEKQMREQQEQERLKEEERKRQAEQREAARREMERQRQLEWEKQRLQELQQQRQREQENVLKLKAKNQTLTIELTTLNDQVKELSQKICDTRVGVSNVKTTIDGMRSTRDSQMQEMSKLKNKLKEQNAKLLALSQEKVKLDAKNKLNNQISGQDAEQARLAYENKEITIKNLKEKIEDMQSQIDGKLSDIENNNTQLAELRTQLTTMVSECEKLYGVYEEKKSRVMEMKNANRAMDYGSSWKNEDAWGSDANTTEWPAESNWGDSNAVEAQPAPVAGAVRYRALYEFVARNNDEISFQPGDIINVPKEQTGEPGWLAGEIRGHTGWFPESYVEPVDGVGVRDIVADGVSDAAVAVAYPEDAEITRLEGIAEVPEVTDMSVQNAIVDNASMAFEETQPTPAPIEPEPEGEPEYYIATYPYQSQEQGDLTFNAGEVIGVVKKDGDWWTGRIGNTVGIFPSNYVQKVDVNSSANTITSATTAPTNIIEAAATALESSNAQTDDNEVSQINENKSVEKPLDASITANAQVMKTKKPEIASVIAPYQASSPEQLSLARGQLIMIRKKTDSGWWEGELQAKGRKRQVGWFPASYVKVLNSSGRASGRTTPVSTTRMQQEVVIDKVVALFPYKAGNPDELSFTKDDIISVTAREEEAWWRGELNGVSGLFPSNYVMPLQQQSSTTTSERRQKYINELIQTEQAYVQDMSTVHNVFEKPLRNSKIISQKEIDEIFVNWKDIIECNKSLLAALEYQCASNNDNIGQIICQHLPNMTAYIVFCGQQLDSAQLLQKLTEDSTAFKDFVKKCQNNVMTKGMPLSSFLIKPMQRITKYPLLIGKILENTDENHSDYKALQEALRMSERFLNCINENVRVKEDQERLDWLQQCVQNDLNLVFNSNTNKLGPRKLLHFGVLTKVKSGKELLGFLFNDFFFLVQPSKSLGSSQFMFQRNSNVSYKIYKQPIMVPSLIISRESTENVEHGTDSNRVLKLQDNKTKYKICLLATTVHECSQWTKKITSAKDYYLKLNSLTQRRTKTLYDPNKWVEITVVSGHEIRSKFNHNTISFSSSSSNRKRPIKNKSSLGKAHSENIYCEVILGNQEQQTDIAKDTLQNGNTVAQNGAPQVPVLIWNCTMQFQIRNINKEILHFVVYEQNQFCPDEFLGRAEVKISDIYQESLNTNGPITKKLILHQVESGEIVVKLDIHIFENY